MNQALNALYELQQVDTALAAAHRRYRALDQGAAEQAAAESARALHERTAQELHETETDLRDAELEQRTVEANKKKYEDKLYGGKVTNFKELESIQQEIEALGRQRGKLDERILTLMDQLEARRAAEAQAAAKQKADDEALARKQAEYKAAARKVALEAQALTAEREKQAAAVAPALLKRYETIRAAKQGVGIGRIEEGRCSVCHQQISGDTIRAVEDTDRPTTCDNCGRLLCVGPAS